MEVVTFENLVRTPEKFMRLYEKLATCFLKLSDVVQLMMLVAQSDEGSMANQISLINDLLESEKTLTMFHTSLNFDKFHFLYAIQALLDDQEYFNVSYMGKNERKRIAKLKKESPLL